jgi:hypothetical protein
MKTVRLLICIIPIICWFGCDNSKEVMDETLKLDVRKTLETYNFSAKSINGSINGKDSLDISLDILNEPFFDAETQSLVIYYLLNDHDDSFSNLEFIRVKWYSDNFPGDTIYYNQDRKQMDEFNRRRVNNLVFKEIFLYSLFNMSNEEYIYANIMRYELDQLLNEKYRFNKGYWDLLYLYSLEYDSDSSEIKDYYTSLCRILTMPGSKFHPKHLDAIDSIIESH